MLVVVLCLGGLLLIARVGCFVIVVCWCVIVVFCTCYDWVCYVDYCDVVLIMLFYIFTLGYCFGVVGTV